MQRGPEVNKNIICLDIKFPQVCSQGKAMGDGHPSQNAAPPKKKKKKRERERRQKVGKQIWNESGIYTSIVYEESTQEFKLSRADISLSRLDNMPKILRSAQKVVMFTPHLCAGISRLYPLFHPSQNKILAMPLSFHHLLINFLQSELGYPATSGPAHIRISDLDGYERYALTQQVQ